MRRKRRGETKRSDGWTNTSSHCSTKPRSRTKSTSSRTTRMCHPWERSWCKSPRSSTTPSPSFSLHRKKAAFVNFSSGACATIVCIDAKSPSSCTSLRKRTKRRRKSACRRHKKPRRRMTRRRQKTSDCMNAQIYKLMMRQKRSDVRIDRAAMKIGEETILAMKHKDFKFITSRTHA